MQGISTNQIIIGNVPVSATGQSLYISGLPVVSKQQGFSKSTIFFDQTGIANGQYFFPLWRAPFDCYITGIHGFMKSGTSAVINARQNNLNFHLVSGMTLHNTGQWYSSGIIASQNYSEGSGIEAIISGLNGLPMSVTVQIDFIKI